MIYLFSLPALAAEVVSNLYQAEVVVENHGRPALQSGMQEALALVLVKVSGRREVLEEEALASMLAAAQDYVQQYQYVRGDNDQLRLQVEFSAALVNDNLTTARLPLWSATRPAVLVWVVVNDNGGRRFASAETDSELLAQIDKAFDQRGVPLVLPLLDIEDALAIAVDDVWEFDSAKISTASERYSVNNILVGQLHQIPGDRWMGEWQYLWQENSYSSSDYGVSLTTIAGAGAALSAEKMAQRYAVEATSESAAQVRVQVQGLANYADYRGALSYLAAIDLVDAALVEFVTEDVVVFSVQAPLQLTQLSRLIELGGRMQPLLMAQSLPEDIAPATLVYQWQP
ncbi:DUF2066 domain-containing protein [Candidatus Litorirhabdus singularis]|nr:DUF2066 domain-containing protein [Candidatus Litorirhabdus singularis]